MVAGSGRAWRRRAPAWWFAKAAFFLFLSRQFLLLAIEGGARGGPVALLLMDGHVALRERVAVAIFASAWRLDGRTWASIFIPSGRRGFGRWDLGWQNYHHTLVLGGLTGRSRARLSSGWNSAAASLLASPRISSRYLSTAGRR